MINWTARLEAIQKAFDLLDVVRGKSEGGGGAAVKFVINMPTWDAPATPDPKIIDVQSTPILDEDDAGDSSPK
jgi:hypothetical protein